MKHVQTVLDNTRQPRLAEDEEHTYDDKYALTEFLTNTSIASQMNALERLGLDPEKIMKVMGWVHSSSRSHSVTLRFVAEDTCQFMMEQEVDMNLGITHEIEKTSAMKMQELSTGPSLFGGGGNTKTETVKTKVITKVKEYHWKVTVSYKIIIFPSNDYEKGLELQKRSTETVIITAAGTGTSGSAAQHSRKIMSPLPERSMHPPIDTKLTWFFQMLSPKEQTCQFMIRRDNISSCRTPRRNDDIKAAENFHKNLIEWTRTVQSFFLLRVEHEIHGKHNPVNKTKPTTSTNIGGQIILEPGSTGIMTGLLKEPSFNGKRVRIVEYDDELQRYKAEPIDDTTLPATLSIKPANIIPDGGSSSQASSSLSTINDDAILCPIIPLLEKNSILDMGDVGEFLTEQSRAIDEMIDHLSKSYPPKRMIKLISITEATIIFICKHMETLATQYLDSIDYIEYMLKEQLTQAIGKEIGSKEFEQFVRFHNRKLFALNYRPNTFSYAIRRPGFYPDGILTIESKIASSDQPTALSTTTMSSPEPIETYTRCVSGNDSPSIFIPINAATAIEMTGDRYLHGWMQHRFKSKYAGKPEFNIACRSRQFCCFILIIGTMSGYDTFEPKDAIVIQNKDEVFIPLLTNVLPSVKEFNDAIASLSPEQQAFAKAFRSMQLESSVFAVCVIQLKPQLEKLLGLPDCSLTKEIQLTQDLLSLFVDYQIPSDLLSLPLASTTTTSNTSSTDTMSTADKVSSVRGYVNAVMDVIASSKEKQLKEEEMRSDMRHELKSNSNSNDESETIEASERPLDGSTVGRSRRSRKMCMNVTSGPQPATGPMMAMMTCAPTQQQPQSTPSSSNPSVSAKTKATITKGSSSRHLTKTQQNQLSSESEKQRLAAAKTNNVGQTSSSLVVGEDFTLIPKLLDAKLEKIDTDGSLRSTIIKAGTSNWKRMRQSNLLVPPTLSTLSTDDIEQEKKKAFDLLDAISRSGTLAVDCSELHIVVGVSHCFENDIMGSVVQDNVNPIEKVERSSVILASCIHHNQTLAKPQQLLDDTTDIKRLSNSFPGLFESK
jgi:hypothetical protein